MRSSPTSRLARRLVLPHRVALFVATAAATACSGGGDAGPVTPPTGGGPVTPGAPASVQVASGDAQSGVVGTRLGAPLGVRVLDAKGAGVPGVAVQWSAQGGSVEPSAGTTDASGAATATWTLGTTAGPMALTVTAGGREARFAATATADRAAVVVATGGVTGDSLVLGAWGETGALAAQARDRHGNAVGGLAVTWSSSDTTVARVDAAGRVTSGRAGVATITMRADSARGTARVVVPVQRNPMCRVPSAVAARGAARGAVTFAQEAGSRFPANLLQYSLKDVVVLDFDRDGRSDVLVFDGNGGAPAPAAGRLFAFRNTGTAFPDVTAAVFGAAPITTINAQFNEIADFDGDGLLDVFVGQSGYDSPPYPGLRNLLLLGGTGGTLREVGAAALSPNPTGFTHGSASGDVDCDGDVDLVENDIHASATTAQSFRVQVNAGRAQFRDEAAARVPEIVATYDRLGNAAYLATTLCDFDRDGDPDLFAGGWYSPRQYAGQEIPDVLLVNDGTGRFRERKGALPAPTFGATTDVDDARCADLDGDGWNDLVLSTIEKSGADRPTSGRIVFWRNNRDMTFTDVTASWAPNQWPSPSYPLRAIVADFNGDGWPDVLGTGYGSPWNGFWTTGVGGNAIFFNRGTAGGFTRVWLENWFGALWPIDVNGDGKLDLLWAGAIQTPDQPPEALPRVYIQR